VIGSRRTYAQSQSYSAIYMGRGGVLYRHCGSLCEHPVGSYPGGDVSVFLRAPPLHPPCTPPVAHICTGSLPTVLFPLSPSVSFTSPFEPARWRGCGWGSGSTSRLAMTWKVRRIPAMGAAWPCPWELASPFQKALIFILILIFYFPFCILLFGDYLFLCLAYFLLISLYF